MGGATATNEVNTGSVSAVFPTTIPDKAITFLAIPAGSFNNGTSTVNLSAFKMSKYEITQSQFQTVMGINPSSFSSKADAANIPVQHVTWYDAVEFCNKLSEKDGLVNVYTITSRDPTTGYPITGATVTADIAKTGYRLPTEAQWEYAARGGNQSQGYTYAGANTIGDVAWYLTNATSGPETVGTKAANELGLFDMSGNVLEWCWDWWGTYESGTQTNPTGPSSGSKRVLRGGGYPSNASECAVSIRQDSIPSYKYQHIGFRVVAPAP